MIGWILGSVAGALGTSGLIIAIIFIWRASTSKDAAFAARLSAELAAQAAVNANEDYETLTADLSEQLKNEREANAVLQRDFAELAARSGASVDAKRVFEDLRALSTKGGKPAG